jgi:hypothetical protein
MGSTFPWTEPKMSERESPMSDTMKNTLNRNEIDELMTALQQLVDTAAAKCPQVSEAAIGLITAVNYDDETLVNSAHASLLAALAELASNCVAWELSATEGTKSGLRAGWQKYINKKAYELAVFDEIKDKIESIIDERIARMLNVRKFVDCLKNLEQEVKNAQALEDGIRDLRRFREELLKGWPSRKPSSPLNKAAIAEARAAMNRGEKGMSKDELAWGNRRSGKAAGE